MILWFRNTIILNGYDVGGSGLVREDVKRETQYVFPNRENRSRMYNWKTRAAHRIEKRIGDSVGLMNMKRKRIIERFKLRGLASLYI